MGHFNLTLMSCLVYINWWWSKPKLFILRYLDTIQVKVRSYFSSMNFSCKYGLRMGQRGFRKMSFQTLKIWIKIFIRILSILSCHSSSSHSQQYNTVHNIYINKKMTPYNSLLILWMTILIKTITCYRISVNIFSDKDIILKCYMLYITKN